MEQKWIAYRCKSCGRRMFPKHDRCLSCKGTEIEEVPLPEEGTVVTWTKLYAPPEGIEMPPLTLGIADFGGVKVLGQILSDNPKTGMKVKPVWGRLRMLRGKEIYGFRFEPK
ncbi:MAG: OB-fold domain-containing protein [Candidatus Hadarchaeales archaeon]